MACQDPILGILRYIRHNLFPEKTSPWWRRQAGEETIVTWKHRVLGEGREEAPSSGLEGRRGEVREDLPQEGTPRARMARAWRPEL